MNSKTTLLGDFDHDKKLLFWVMMSMMSGGSHDQQGFNNNFNMMLPLVMRDCNDAACEKQKLDIMTVMIAMQSNVRYINIADTL